MKTKHTPTPWAASQHHEGYIVPLSSSPFPNCEVIATAYSCYGNNRDENRKKIVHCVNLHDELVECLRRLRMHCTDKYDAKQIDDLLLKVKES